MNITEQNTAINSNEKEYTPTAEDFMQLFRELSEDGQKLVAQAILSGAAEKLT